MHWAAAYYLPTATYHPRGQERGGVLRLEPLGTGGLPVVEGSGQALDLD